MMAFETNGNGHLWRIFSSVIQTMSLTPKRIMISLHDAHKIITFLIVTFLVFIILAGFCSP